MKPQGSNINFRGSIYEILFLTGILVIPCEEICPWLPYDVTISARKTLTRTNNSNTVHGSMKTCLLNHASLFLPLHINYIYLLIHLGTIGFRAGSEVEYNFNIFLDG